MIYFSQIIKVLIINKILNSQELIHKMKWLYFRISNLSKTILITWPKLLNHLHNFILQIDKTSSLIFNILTLLLHFKLIICQTIFYLIHQYLYHIQLFLLVYLNLLVYLFLHVLILLVYKTHVVHHNLQYLEQFDFALRLKYFIFLFWKLEV